MTALDELKRRKVAQWALAYLAAAWVALQLVAILAGQFGWPTWVQRGATILLAAGFFIAVVLAWYHGEKGRQRVSGPELLMVAGILVMAGAAIALVRGEPGVAGGDSGAAAERGGPDDEGAVADVPGGRDGPATAARPSGTDPGPLDRIPERSIAVLPLDNLSPSEEHAWFAGAMTEQITSALSKVPDLRVTSRNSASKFPASGMTVREFATGELRVAHVLEGSVQRVGDEVQITVQLIDARTDDHLWSESYERTLTDVLEVQAAIAREVAERLAASFFERQAQRILAGATDDPVAYDLYLRYLEIPWVGATPEQLGEKSDLLRRAVARDTTFGLAWAHFGIDYFSHVQSDEDPRADSSRAALDQAVALTEGSTRAWVRAVRALLFQRSPEVAIARLRDAAAADPSNPFLLDALSRVYELAGDYSAAIRYRRRVAAVDPLNFWQWRMLSSQYRRLGLFDQADQALRRAIELAPETTVSWMELVFYNLVRGRYGAALAAADSLEARGDPRAPLWRGLAHLWADEIEKAHEAFARAPEQALEDEPEYLPTLAHVRFLLGDTAGARRMLKRAESSLGSGIRTIRPQGDPLLALEIAAVRGDPGAAVDALRAYVEVGGRDVYQIHRNPLFSRVRGDSAFSAELAELERLVERMRREVQRDLSSGR